MAEPQAVEQEARALGWVPQEEWRGDPEHWSDAETFVERGKHVMPILKKNNERLQAQLRERDERLAKMEESLQASQESIQALEEHYTAANKRQLAEARTNLLAELKAAKDAGDTASEVQIVDELTRVNEATTEAAETKKPAEKKEAAAVELAPEVKALIQANPWYGTDVKKTLQFNRLAEDMRLDGNTLQGKPFLDAVMEKFEAGTRSTNTKVEAGGATSRGGSASRNGNRFSDLPADAKKVCHDDAKRFVGEGKRFKTLADWEKKYAEIYFGDES